MYLSTHNHASIDMLAYRLYEQFRLHKFLVLKITGFLGIWLTISGDANLRKEILWQEFEWAHMRDLPCSIAAYERVKNFDVVFQRASTFEADMYYPNTYMVGIYNPYAIHYERVHLLSRVNPFKEYDLVKAISDHYQTDSTYMDVLIRNKKNVLQALVYRKIKPEKREYPDVEYIMWRREKIVTKKDGFKTRLIEQWNSHLFE